MKRAMLSTTLRLCIFSFLPLMWIGCDTPAAEIHSVDYIAASKEKMGRIGLLNARGEWVLENAFPSNSQIICTDGVITELINPKGVRYHKISNKQLVPLFNKQYATGTAFFNGYATVTDLEGRLKILTKEGLETEIQNVEGIQIIRAGVVTDGLIRVKTSTGKWGYLTASGKWALTPKYLVAESFTQGKARVKDSLGIVHVIDTKGDPLFNGKEKIYYTPVSLDRIGSTKDIYNPSAGFQIELLTGVIKSSGAYMNSLTFTKEGNGIISDKDGKFGVVDKDGNVIGDLNTRFNSMPVELKTGFVASDEAVLLFFDKTGKRIQSIPGFKNPMAFQNMIIAKAGENQYQIFSEEGNKLGGSFYVNNPYSNSGLESFTEFKKGQSLASGWFDFDGILNDALEGLSPSGIHSFDASSNIQDVVKKLELLSNSSSSTTPLYNNDEYSFLLYAGLFEPGPYDEGEWADEPAQTVPASDTVKQDFSDEFKRIPLYSSSYASSFKNGAGASFSVTANFDAYLKIDRWGYEVDPIFRTEVYKFLGYQLNPNAKLQSVQIYISPYSTEQQRFQEKLAEHLRKKGWATSGNGEFRSPDTGNRIKFEMSGITYLFS